MVPKVLRIGFLENPTKRRAKRGENFSIWRRLLFTLRVYFLSHKGEFMIGGTQLLVRRREYTPTIHNNNLVFGEGKYKTIILDEFAGVLMAW